MTLVLPGHKVDAKQACVYKLMCPNRRLYMRRPDLRVLLEETWRLNSGRNYKGSYGLLRSLAAAADKLQWTWRDPWHFVNPSGMVISHLNGDDKLWKHVLRAELRSMVWREDTLTKRKDMQGLHDVDDEATVDLYRRSQRHTTQCLKGKRRAFTRDLLDPTQLMRLRTILTCCIRSRERLVLGNRAKSMLCPFCQDGPETAVHIFWSCKTWAAHRSTVHEKYPVLCWTTCQNVPSSVASSLMHSEIVIEHFLRMTCKNVLFLSCKHVMSKAEGQEWLDFKAGEVAEPVSNQPQSPPSALPEYVRLNPANAEPSGFLPRTRGRLSTSIRMGTCTLMARYHQTEGDSVRAQSGYKSSAFLCHFTGTIKS